MTAALDYARYHFEGHDELCLRAGVGHPTTILIIPPLFDEMNRMRRMLVDMMRLLNERGIGSALPDLPGMNESLFPQEQTNLMICRQALVECFATLPKCRHIASFRSGCLIDDFTDSAEKWRLSPVKGLKLLRMMMRARIASDKEAGLSTDMTQLAVEAEQGHVNLAGNHISSTLFSELQDAAPEPSDIIRTAVLENNASAANVRLAGSALWLRAEPGDDMLLSGAIATDLTSWIAA
ncbi:hypothetical protein [Parasphingorhabdus cellanae]|uniref:Uncharacterized protein n=1 Tax=Parasphingorhabdus cellanae TaxID=2806553 RepID=A0ABX7T8Y1_9SPHN|nr:hypothetical protein [Parasphingorhabdus cellanae]QTD56458.1 hypothetical protein J4G78_02325 [Parasphingorhabdus cellanae]